MSTIDAQGNLHRGTGHGGGQFEAKQHSAPSNGLKLNDVRTVDGGDEATVLAGVAAALPPGHPLRKDQPRLRAVALSVCEGRRDTDLLGHMEDRGISAERLGALVAGTMKTADLHSILVSIPGDDEWPAGLEDMGGEAPAALWSKGDLSMLGDKGNVIVMGGARAATGYGEHVAIEFAIGLADQGHVIATGGAYGIDGAASRAAMSAGGRNAVVVAGGIDSAYPSGHQQMFDDVVERGGVVLSEVPPGSTPTRQRFLRRNEMLAALGGVTVIVEAGPRSGSLGIAGNASALGRKVLAVPGPVTSAASIGSNELIASGQATAVMSASDVHQHLTS